MTRIIFPCMMIFIFFMSTAGAHAGTFIAGAKSWFAFWESGVINQYETRMKTSGTIDEIEKDPGKGFLAGPLFGYQADDGKWSFGLAFMAISYFQQDMTGKQDGGPDIQFETSLRRMDFDIAVNYRINQYMKAIAGYKHLYYKLELENKSASFTETYTAHVSMPTAGIGLSYPLSNTLVGGLQLGILYVIPSVEVESDMGGSMELETENSFGFNGEAAISYILTQSVILELGYRVQAYEYTANVPGDPAGDTRDLTHGVVISAYYLF